MSDEAALREIKIKANKKILIAAPGNWVRMDSNTEFVSLSFIEKIICLLFDCII